jgi:hypothetical protein
VDFEYTCGWCGAENAVWAKPTGFWTEKYLVPAEWDCYLCDGLNYTPDD